MRQLHRSDGNNIKFPNYNFALQLMTKTASRGREKYSSIYGINVKC